MTTDRRGRLVLIDPGKLYQVTIDTKPQLIDGEIAAELRRVFERVIRGERGPGSDPGPVDNSGSVAAEAPTQPAPVDDEAVAEALRIFLEHERFSRSDAMRKVLIWARQHFGSHRTAFETYVTLGSGGGGGGGSDEMRPGPPWFPISTGS